MRIHALVRCVVPELVIAGAEEDMLENGDSIEYTQAPQNLEQLLGQFIFSMSQSDDDEAETSEVDEENAI